MNRNDAIEALIENLKSQHQLTELEKDILDTANEIDKDRFDKDSAIQKIITNNIKYWANRVPIPNSNLVPLEQLSNDDLKANLSNQLIYMCGLLTAGGNQ